MHDKRYQKAEGVQAEGQRSQTPVSPDPQFNIYHSTFPMGLTHRAFTAGLARLA
jgi:hypothetical protein